MSDKFHDLAETYGETMPASVSPDEKHYPSVNLNLDALSELKSAELGGDVEILFLACVKSMSLDENSSRITLDLKKACIYSVEEKPEEEKPLIKNKSEEPKNEADHEFSRLARTGGY